MNELDLQRHRAQLLRAAIQKVSDGNVTTFGKRLGYRDGAYIRQMLSGTRPIREKTIFAIEDLPGLKGFFSAGGSPDFIVEDEGKLLFFEMKSSDPAVVEDQERKYEFSLALDRCVRGGVMTAEAAELVKAVIRADIAGVSEANFKSVRQILDTLTNAQKAKSTVNPPIEESEPVAELPSDQDVDDAIKSALPGANLEAAGHERPRGREHKRKSG